MRDRVVLREAIVIFWFFSGRHVWGMAAGAGKITLMNNVSDGFRDERRFEFFFDIGGIGFSIFPEPTFNPDDKGKGSFKKEDDGRSPVVINNMDGAFSSYLIVVIDNMVFCISDIDFDLGLMMFMALLFILDDLAYLLSIPCDIGDGYGQFNFKMEFNGG